MTRTFDEAFAEEEAKFKAEMARIKTRFDAGVAEQVARYDATVAPVKAILDGMEVALRLKDKADREYALRVRPLVDAKEKAEARAKHDFKKWQDAKRGVSSY